MCVSVSKQTLCIGRPSRPCRLSQVTEDVRNLAGPSESLHSSRRLSRLFPLELVSQYLQAPLVEQCTSWSDAKDINSIYSSLLLTGIAVLRLYLPSYQ